MLGSAQVSSGASAVALHAVQRTPARLSLTNPGLASVYVGPAGVTTASGYPVAAGASVYFLLAPSDQLFVVSAAAQTVGVLLQVP